MFPFLSFIAVVSAASCPDLPSMRSDEVKSSFNPELMHGGMFQQAYIDIAEIGARCPVMNTTFDATSGILSTRFKVHYGPLPFTIVENYYPRNATGPHKSKTPDENPILGFYTKEVNMPGASLLTLPTVFVDAQPNANKTHYHHVTQFTCTVKLDLEVKELQFQAETSELSTWELLQMESVALKLGVPFEQKDLHVLNRTKLHCKDG